MRFLEGLSSRAGIVGELLGFFWANKWWWMTPVIVMLMFIGVMMIFAHSSIAPFIYTLF